MTTEEQIKYAAWLSRVGLLRMGAIRQSCIASAKVTTEVLRALDIPARPMAASVMAMTEGWCKRMEAEGPPRGTNGTEVLERWWEEDRAWSAGVLYDPTPQEGAWTAHMIVLAGAGQRFLIDPSLDQLARPERDLPLEPAVVDMVTNQGQEHLHEFRRGRTQAIATFSDDNSQRPFMVVWSCFPADRSFRELGDFRLFQVRYGRMARSIVEAIDDMRRAGLTGDQLPPLPPIPDAYDDPNLRVREKSPEELSRLKATVDP